MLRVGFLLDHPSPHMVALLDAMAVRDDCASEVIYLRTATSNRAWGAPKITLPSRALSADRLGLVSRTVEIVRYLTQARADIWVVNTIYTTPETWSSAATLSSFDIPWVYMNEPPNPKRYGQAKEATLRLLLSRSDGLIGMGKETTRRYAALTGGTVPCVSVPYVVELDEFRRLPLRSRKQDDIVRFLAVGQLIERKGFDILCEAVSLLPAHGWSLTIVGEGPLRAELEEDFSKVRGGDRVRFAGPVQYHSRSLSFSEADVFVFPSRWDGWGMAPVEALAAGLPVITTDQVMSMYDFISEGKNGFMIPTEDPIALADRMARFISRPEMLSDMQRAARASTDAYRADTLAEHLVCFLRQIEADAQKGVIDANPQWRLDASPKRALLTGRRGLLRRTTTAVRAALKSAVIRSASSFDAMPKGDRILAYHLVLPEDRRNFDEQVAFLADHFEILTVEDLLADKDRTDARPRAAISFDDAFRILLDDALDVMDRRGVKATFYAPTGFVSVAGDYAATIDYCRRAFRSHLPLEPMRSEELSALRGLGHEISSHGVNHLSISSVSEETARNELVRSRMQLQEWLGFAPTGFAYPYGDVLNPLGAPEKWLTDAGYQYGVTMCRGDVRKAKSAMLLPRDHVEGDWPLHHLRYFLSRPSS